MKLAAHLGIAAGLLATVSGIAAAQPAGYTIQALPPISQLAGRNSNANGLNELGHVAGVAEDDFFGTHAVKWVDGQVIDLRDEPPVVPGSTFIWAKGINNLGQTVGQGTEPYPGGGSQGCAMSHIDGVGLFNPRDGDPIGGGGWAWGVNDSGQISFRAGSTYVYDPIDGVREVRLPDGAWELWEINNAGVVCGSGRAPDGKLHAIRYDYDTDTVTDLVAGTMFDGFHSDAYGLNELGDIVGWGWGGSGYNPIVWAADGRTIVLATGDLGPAHIDSQSEHINSQGDVVGLDVSAAAEPPIGWIAYDALNVGPADVTTQGAGVGNPGYGVPDRLITSSDLNYYVNAWVALDVAIADLTTQGAGVGDPGYGVPDGLVSAADINYFVNAWVTGPTANPPTKIVLRTVLSPTDQLAWTRMHPFEINDAGQICGTGIVNGETRGFLMTPVPNN